MKLSKNFVKDYIDIDVDIKTLAEDMTRVGNEYDSAENLINATNLVVNIGNSSSKSNCNIWCGSLYVEIPVLFWS